MISSAALSADNAFVWTWLPGTTTPVVAGRLDVTPSGITFVYGRSYLQRQRAIPLSPLELPLISGLHAPSSGHDMHGTIRDGSPDAWGRRVILEQMEGAHGADLDTASLSEMTYLLASNSNRIGALDFQASATDYVPRQPAKATLGELMQAAELIEAGQPLTPELAQAIQHGTSIGGARPKAPLMSDDGKTAYIAKFSTSADQHNVVKAEYVAMQLAQACGLDVANTSLTQSLGKDALLVERFDRDWTPQGMQRHHMHSALTLMGLDETEARYAGYDLLAERIRHTDYHFAEPKQDLKELFSRLVFNVICGNTDDHARNHAALWDGRHYRLTPAYDICPQFRTGGEAIQGMSILQSRRHSQLSLCLEAAPHFLLSASDALAIMHHQIQTVMREWPRVASAARLSPREEARLKERTFFHPYIFYGAPETLPRPDHLQER